MRTRYDDRPVGAHSLTLLWAALVLLLLLASAGPLKAQSDDAPTSGTLRLRDGTSAHDTQATRLGTDITVRVSGQMMRVKVVQAFRNTGPNWVEASYVYPLPEDGAVDTLKMVVGNRVIMGEIKRRGDAKAAYESARREGRRAGLVEEERPNVFTTSLANLGPGQTALIEIEYQAPVRVEGADSSLRLPLVVGPRYSPPVRDAVDPVPDRDRITPPVLDPRSHRLINPVSITVHLDPGFPLGGITSPYLAVEIAREGANGRVVRLADTEVPADRDFVLAWHSAAEVPVASLFRETIGSEHYLLASVTPPARRDAQGPPPREMIFVIDNSGSMGGESIRQAKQSLDYALAHLGPRDRFNLIRFDDTLTVLYPEAVAADEGHVRDARAFVERLDAAGGTEMRPALEAALKDPTPQDRSRLRQVIVLTDGEIGNEAELLGVLGRGRGRSHVFMVGIGSAPNMALMSRLAETGRGTYTAVGSISEVESRMHTLLDRLTDPVATDLTVTFLGTDGQATPALLPDLYRGEPLTLAAKVSALTGQVRLAGTVDAKPWHQDLAIRDAPEAEGVSKLWAKRRIADAEVAHHLGDLSDDDAKAAIASLGLRYGLVTGETSLVAVDTTRARPAEAALRPEELPIDLPAGWDFAKLFGGASAGRPPAPAAIGGSEQRLLLPKTGTDAGVLLSGGSGMVLLGICGLLALRSRRSVSP